MADLHSTHGRRDRRTSRDAALVNKESSCRLSPAEIVASGSGWRIGWMGERLDWPITAPILDRWSRQEARARDVGHCMVHRPQRGDGEG
jgi:hypothetical protein